MFHGRIRSDWIVFTRSRDSSREVHMSTRPLRKVVTALGFLAIGLLLLTGCGNGNVQLRFVNTSPGESSVDFSLDGSIAASAIAYGTGSSYQSTVPGSRHLQVYPSGTTNVIIDQTINLSSGTEYSLIAINFSSQISTTLLSDDNSTPTSGNMKLRIVNASPGLGAVDVYVVSPGTDLNTATPSVRSLAFESSSGYLVESAGSWQIIFTSPGQKTALLNTGTLTFTSSQIRTLVTLNATVGGYTTTLLDDLN